MNQNTIDFTKETKRHKQDVKDKCVSCGSIRLRHVNYGNSICYRPEVQCCKCGYIQPDTDKEEHKINPPKGGPNIKKGDR